MSKPAKCFVVTHADGSTTTKTSYDPYASETRKAKAEIIRLSGSGAPITISVIEHINSKTFLTDGHGTIKTR